MRSFNSEKKRRYLIFILKLLIGIALLAALIMWKDNGRKVLDLLSRLRWQYLILLLGLALILAFVSCLKWNLFLVERSVKVSILRLMLLYLIGSFFNNFMPSMIGGDLTRIYLLGRQIDSKSISAASVFLERFTGLIALLIIALIFSCMRIELISNPIIGTSIAVMILVSLGIVIFFCWPKLTDIIFSHLPSTPIILNLSSKLKVVYQDIIFFNKHFKLLSLAMLYSFIFHLLTSVNVYASCLSLDFQTPFLDIAVVTPIILLLNNIPVSINNIGWWEWSFSLLFMGVGADAELGLAVALTLRGITLILSLVGGVLFLFERPHTSSG